MRGKKKVSVEANQILPYQRNPTVKWKTIGERKRSRLKNKTGNATNNKIVGTKYVPGTGFEPARLAAPPPQDGVSTNFTTRAISKYE